MEKNNAAVFGGFTRLRDFPLDTSSVFATEAALQEYVTRSDSRPMTAYSGQIVSVLETKSIYLIHRPKTSENTFADAYSKICDDSDLQEFLSSINGIKTQIEAEITLFKANLLDLDNNDDFNRLKERFNAFESSINSQMAVIETNFQRNIAEAIANNSDVITQVINQEIAKVVNGAPETFDTLKEIADVLNEDNGASASILTSIGNISNRVSALENYDFSDFATVEDLNNLNIGQDFVMEDIAGSIEKDLAAGQFIKDIKITFFEDAANYAKSIIPNFNLAYLYNKTNNEVEKIFISSEEIDHENLADSNQLPSTYTYNISYKIPDNESEYSIKIDLYKLFNLNQDDPIENIGTVNITYA